MKFTRSQSEVELGISWWQHMKFELFGELKIFYWLIGIAIFFSLTYYSSLIFVFLHFILKYW